MKLYIAALFVLLCTTSFAGLTPVDPNPPTSANTANAVVKRNGSGGFFAGSLGLNQSSIAGALHVKALDSSLPGGLVLEGSGTDGSRFWDFFVNASTSVFTIYNPNAGNSLLTMQPNGLVSAGQQAPDFHFDVNGNLSATDPTLLTPNTSGSTLDVRNNDNTANNYSALIFQGSNSSHAYDSLIAGVHETHTNPPTGHLGFFTNNAGTVSEVLRLTKDKITQHYGHLKSVQTSVPTAAPTANAGTGASCSVANATDVAGTITLTTTAVSSASGAECDVTFNQAYGVAPICTVTPAGSVSALDSVIQGIYFTTATTKLTVNFANTDAVGRTYAWAYHCIETQ